MALLSEKERKEYMEFLGYEYNTENVKALQKKYMWRKSDADGVWGANTDNMIRTLYNVKKYTKNFDAKEFRCECGGKYCCGFPTYMKPVELQHIQTIRDHYGKPITITCGMRCKGYNKHLNGSISNSLHLTGNAIDFYQAGVTDTLANRRKSIKYIKTLPGHHYTYGNGINSYGASVSASYMGNALHTDTQGSVAPSDGKLNVDGKGGPATVKAMQRFFGTGQDGVISGQNKNLGKYYPALTAVKYGSGGSATIKKLQKWLGTTEDGVLGKLTVMAWQKKLGVSSDGVFGTASMKAWQKHLNANEKAVYPQITEVTQVTKVTPDPVIKPVIKEGSAYTGSLPALPAKVTVSKASLLAELANEYAYPSNTTKARYKGGVPKAAYKAGLKKAYPNRSSWGAAPKKGASCDVFAGTCIRNAGIDSKYPRGFSPDYTGKSGKFTKVSKSNVQSGDVIFLAHHVCIAYGGKIKEASNGDFYPKTTSTLSSRIKSAKVIYRAKGYTQISRNYLKKGDSGTAILQLQLYLKWFGYDIEADGVFGSATNDAVKDMQKKLGATADGLVGSGTLAAMRTFRK